MMLNVIKSEKCTGCGMCHDKCPKGAIDMKYNDNGFLEPFINFEKCIKCGICEKGCPENNISEIRETNQQAFAGWSKIKQIRKSSTSGGIFKVLAEYILEENGVVCGAVFKNPVDLRHVMLESKEKISRMSGSKYIQSNMSGIYRKVEEKLKENRKVLFSGTPCQINALRCYLKRDYENLFTCEVLCHGIASTKWYIDVLLDITKGNLEKIKEVEFRNKDKGWEKSQFIVVEKNGKKHHCLSYWGAFGYPFSRQILSRKVCLSCRFSAKNRVADITLGDYSGNDKDRFCLEDRYLGISIILTNSSKGEYLIKKIADKIEVYERDINFVVMSSPAMRKRVSALDEWKEFWTTYNYSGYEIAKKFYGTPTKKEFIWYKYNQPIQRIYQLFKKLGIK